MKPFKCRASSVGRLMTRMTGGELGQGTKDVVLADVLYQGFNYYKELDAKMINKGNILEDEAIRLVGLLQAENFTKNAEYRHNKWFTGSCDIFNGHSIRDTKVSWSIDSFPWTQAEAEAMVKKMGYDWQVMIYMMLWGVKKAYVDFVLLPTPRELLKYNDDEFIHIDIVNKIDPSKRVKTVEIEYDERRITEAKLRVDDCQDYHRELYKNIVGNTDNE